MLSCIVLYSYTNCSNVLGTVLPSTAGETILLPWCSTSSMNKHTPNCHNIHIVDNEN